MKKAMLVLAAAAMMAGCKEEPPVKGGLNVAENGHKVSVHYTGRLQSNGQKFDSSVDRGQPFTFMLGGKQVIACWDEGVLGMKVGEKKQLICTPDKAYGASGAGGVIPPNATLVFDVELLGVE